MEKNFHPADEVKAEPSHSNLKRIPLALFILLGFTLFFGGFSGSDTLAVAEEIYPSFGGGEVEVRIYANYFCGPCSRLEPQIEHLVGTMVKENRIKLLFIDRLFNRKSSAYDRYLSVRGP